MIQTVENDALRQRLGLPKGINGVMVAQPYRDDSRLSAERMGCHHQIGDMPIDSDGKVAIRYDLRLSSSYLCRSMPRTARCR